MNSIILGSLFIVVLGVGFIVVDKLTDNKHKHNTH